MKQLFLLLLASIFVVPHPVYAATAIAERPIVLRDTPSEYKKPTLKEEFAKYREESEHRNALEQAIKEKKAQELRREITQQEEVLSSKKAAQEFEIKKKELQQWTKDAQRKELTSQDVERLGSIGIDLIQSGLRKLQVQSDLAKAQGISKEGPSFETYNEIADLAKHIEYEQPVIDFLNKNPETASALKAQYKKMFDSEVNPNIRLEIAEKLIDIADASLKQKGLDLQTIAIKEMVADTKLQEAVLDVIETRLLVKDKLSNQKTINAINNELQSFFNKLGKSKELLNLDFDTANNIGKMRVLEAQFKNNPDMATQAYLSLANLFNKKLQEINQELQENPLNKRELVLEKQKVLAQTIDLYLQAAQEGKKIDLIELRTMLEQDKQNLDATVQEFATQLNKTKKESDRQKLQKKFEQQLKDQGKDPNLLLIEILTNSLDQALISLIDARGSLADFYKNVATGLQYAQKVFESAPDKYVDELGATKDIRNGITLFTSISTILSGLKEGFGGITEPRIKPEQLANEYKIYAQKTLNMYTSSEKPAPQLLFDTLQSFRNAKVIYEKLIYTNPELEPKLRLEIGEITTKLTAPIPLEESVQRFKDLGLLDLTKATAQYNNDVAAYIEAGATRAKRQFMQKLPHEGFMNLLEKHDTKLLAPKTKRVLYKALTPILIAITLSTTLASVWSILQKLGVFEDDKSEDKSTDRQDDKKEKA